VHRVEVGIEPACVIVCPEQAIIAGDLDDPTSKIAKIVATEQVFVRAPEQGTNPKLWYKGAEQVNLDPLMAEVGPGR
jgi:Fe-S-cluster-containing dehydrogenase component